MRRGTVGRLAGVAAAFALAACGKVVEPVPGPLGALYKPTGIAVQHRPGGNPRLIVVSSNGDLQYDSATGGSVIALESFEGDFLTTGYRVTGAVNVGSFGGDLVLVDPSACGTIPGIQDPSDVGTSVAAFFATRGSSTLNKLRLTADGQLGCAECGIHLSGTFTDPLPVVMACRPGIRASAFVGYLQGHNQEGWITQYDLATGATQNFDVGNGPVRNLAYDAVSDRLYILGLTTYGHTPLRYVDLGGCTLGPGLSAGGCATTYAVEPFSWASVEERSMAFASDNQQALGGPRRAYVTARVYDAGAASATGTRATDLGGKLYVVDLLQGPLGVVVDVVDEVDIGKGAQDVRVLPTAGFAPGRGDIVAVLSVDDSFLWVYDTETRALGKIGRDPVTGAPLGGGYLYGLAVDPVAASSVARLYVGSYADSRVVPIDVPLDDVSAVDFAGGTRHDITGAP
jgi:hypothetical protein